MGGTSCPIRRISVHRRARGLRVRSPFAAPMLHSYLAKAECADDEWLATCRDLWRCRTRGRLLSAVSRPGRSVIEL